MRAWLITVSFIVSPIQEQLYQIYNKIIIHVKYGNIIPLSNNKMVAL